MYPATIHILGAPGAGVSTLGKHLAETLGVPHFDTDDYHWFTSDPLPYKRRRNPEHRRQLLSQDLEQHPAWVLSGSLCGWGDVFIPKFEAVVYLWLPADIRLARIRARETRRYGAEAIAPGGSLHTVFEKFCTWAAHYDTAANNICSRQHELQWLQQLSCPVIHIENDAPVQAWGERVMREMRDER